MTARPPHARGGFAARQPARSPFQLRADWVSAIASGRASVRQPYAEGDLVPAFTVALRHLQAENFPIEAWSAREMAKAFLILARVLCGRDIGPETRTACAPALAACAEALDGLLTGLRTAEAQGWLGRTGEKD